MAKLTPPVNTPTQILYLHMIGKPIIPSAEGFNETKTLVPKSSYKRASLTCVYVSMLLHVRLLVESFTTVLAGVRPGVRMNQHMCGQSR